ncbi:anaphase-promoting complex subunit 2 [Rhodotorula toruloides]|uniref:Anaphase-promoting complex subunit 2 n=1 Tax=Rhodotorula toruloides TaxID=5286 RepID=A0A511KEV0_RHOTO|nr:anaphase-promoting complex subunit 2 [Rhodotorula toruloides]
MELDVLRTWHSAHLQLTATVGQLNRVAEAWRVACDELEPQRLWQGGSGPCFEPSERLVEAAQVLHDAGLTSNLLDHYLDAVRRSFYSVRAEVDESLDCFEASPPDDRFDILAGLLHSIGLRILRWQQPVSALWAGSSSSLSAFRKSFLSSLYFILPPRFAPALQSFLRTLLTFEHPSHATSDVQFRALPTLITILDRYDPLLFALIYEEIESKVQRECRGVYSEKKLEGLLQGLNGAGTKGEAGGVMGWVSGIYESAGEGGNEEARKFLKPTFLRFEYHVYKMLCQLRTSELFEIILAYPASKPALEDLKTCLYKTDQRGLLVSRLREQVARRLLQPGSDTKEIITAYIATIRCLRIVDPPGVLLSRVADPFRKYLRARSDTTRCIVSYLIEDGNPLFEELVSTDAKLVSDSRDEAESYNDPKWTPDPVDAPADFRKSKGADVIQLLVSIYDTKDVFVKELQVLLAQRLLAIQDYAFEREVKNLTTLKARFGEQALQGCDVMLKDLQDSQRMDQRVHEQIPDVPLHATVVSRLFWPSFQPAPLKLPGQLGRRVPAPPSRAHYKTHRSRAHSAQASYDCSFASLQSHKKLRWLPQLGSVNLTIELKDRTITVDATPLQAAVLELFDKQDTWTSDALQTELRVADLGTVRNALYYWNNLGVVASVPDDMWRLVEEQGAEEQAAAASIAHVVEEEKAAVQSVESRRIEEMRIFWQYIQGMLTNLGALPLSRIHSTLNMLAPGYKGKTIDELTALLEQVMSEGLLQKTASGSWKIVK